MIILPHEQGTPEWLASRIGLPSASKFSDIITTKGEPSKSRIKYMHQLAGERVTKAKEETYQSAAMSRGILMEGEARRLFEMVKDIDVQQVGLCLEDNRRWGCSPDGLTLEDGGLEIKCPSMAVHVSYLLGNKLPTDYFQQVQGSLFVTGREYWWFMSYYPGIKPLFVKVEPDLKFHAALQLELELFSDELSEIVGRITI